MFLLIIFDGPRLVKITWMSLQKYDLTELVVATLVVQLKIGAKGRF